MKIITGNLQLIISICSVVLVAIIIYHFYNVYHNTSKNTEHFNTITQDDALFGNVSSIDVSANRLTSDTINVNANTNVKNLNVSELLKTDTLNVGNARNQSIKSDQISAINKISAMNKVCLSGQDCITQYDIAGLMSDTEGIKNIMNTDSNIRFTFDGGASFNIVPPQGSKGERGPKGVRGPIGPQGPTGNKGLEGLKGPTGFGVSNMSQIKIDNSNITFVVGSSNVVIPFESPDISYVEYITYDSDTKSIKYKNVNSEPAYIDVPQISSIGSDGTSIDFTLNNGKTEKIGTATVSGVEISPANEYTFNMHNNKRIGTGAYLNLLSNITLDEKNNYVFWTTIPNHKIVSDIVAPVPATIPSINNITYSNDRYVFWMSDGQKVVSDVTSPNCITSLSQSGSNLTIMTMNGTEMTRTIRLANNLQCNYRDGVWSDCSTNCGDGVQMQTKTLVSGDPLCPKQMEEIKVCNLRPCPVDCVQGDWGEWTTCSLPCGGGKQTRTRKIATPAANGGTCNPATETRDCNTQSCARDCVLGDWGGWSSCTASCGGGKQSRTRTIATQAINGGTCNPPTETRDCNTQACPVDCVMDNWSSWSSCSESCGTGTSRRTRQVLVQPANGGTPCGPTTETRYCNTQACPVDCRYTTTLGDCVPVSGTCGGQGRRYIRYDVITPPSNGGAACPVSDYYTCWDTPACACARPPVWCTHAGASAWQADCSGSGSAGDWVCVDTAGNRGTVKRSNNCQIELQSQKSSCPAAFGY